MGTVDTLKAFEVLTAADMPERQARALVGIVNDWQEARLGEVATKSDLKELDAKLDVKIANLETKIESVKFDLLKWLMPILLSQLALTITILLKLLQ